MKVVTYNIHKGMDINNKFTLNKVGDYLKTLDCDIICLQEVLYPQFIALKKILKYNGVFATNVNKPVMKYGICIICKNGICNYEHIFLTSKNEQRGFLFANVFSQYEKINIINTHLGLDRYERYNQISEILDYTENLVDKTIVCGDFNEKNINIDEFNDAAVVTNNCNICTFEKSNSRIDYIFIDKTINIKKYSVNKVNLSDHYPVIVEIQ
ncbi:endonuclease/exonuclease/phosphatase family protein [Romboutsia sp.]|uniref:endonuclease/exonuclease/phosphatase family protein n=1 Tax=Romboutsia sp. TaxID=1965302 RepID=UPI003F2F488A